MRHDQFGGFKGRKSFAAAQTFAAAAHRIAFGHEARIDYLGIKVTTKRAMHLSSSSKASP
jgi:hypothetical protein